MRMFLGHEDYVFANSASTCGGWQIAHMLLLTAVLWIISV